MNPNILNQVQHSNYYLKRSSSALIIAPCDYHDISAPFNTRNNHSNVNTQEQKDFINLSLSESKNSSTDDNKESTEAKSKESTTEEPKEENVKYPNWFKQIKPIEHLNTGHREPSSPICSYFDSSLRYLSEVLQKEKNGQSKNFIEKGSFVPRKSLNLKDFKLNNNSVNELSLSSSPHFSLKSTENNGNINSKYCFNDVNSEKQFEGKHAMSSQIKANKFNEFFAHHPQPGNILKQMQMKQQQSQLFYNNNNNIIYFHPRNNFYNFNTQTPGTLAALHWNNKDESTCLPKQTPSIKQEKKKAQKSFVEREGDWICTSCKNWNFAFRVVCNRCYRKKSETSSTTTNITPTPNNKI